MGGRSAPFTGVALALELVNTIDMLEDLPDFLRSTERLERFLRHVGNEAAKASTQAQLDELRGLREQLTRAMDSDERHAATLLATLAATLDLRPRLVRREPHTWEIQLGPAPTEGLGGLAASAVVGLMELLVAGRWDRIGRCAGAPCCCLFVDRTKNRNRRFCCQLCADRVNQAKSRTRNR
jgi:predicted RNA-binding Zn ribbon-like protein